MDIQEATDWYNEQVPGCGSRFQKQVKFQINSLKINPNGYAIRYADVHCMLIKKFPFLVHFTVDESKFIVKVFAVVHTSRNPKIWEEKRRMKN
ncbi:MAG: type II toxin-antitoxin system RelE/ParE family toxin [Cytophagales bacterium]|nr:type II toxin-antitoxin system RelE/ParE family toxin [Cytophagales bacterium]